MPTRTPLIISSALAVALASQPLLAQDQWILSKRFQSTQILPENLDQK